MATIKDISNLTGLSLGTISNYLNGKGIRPQNATLIEEAIKKINYYPNNIGKSLRLGDTNIVGVIANDISSPYISNVISFLELKFSQTNYRFLICDSHNNLKSEKSHINFLIGLSVSCILLFPISYYKTSLSDLVNSNTPFILCDSEPRSYNDYCPTINYKNEELAYETVELLIKEGHREIACICGPKDHYSTKTRLSGYMKALKDYEIPFRPDNIFYCDFDNDLSYQATVNMLEKNTPATACLITVNNMLLGFLRALNDKRKEVMKDISYITFSYAPYYDILPVKPTYVLHDTDSIQKNIFEFLEEIVLNKNYTQETKKIKKFSESKIIIGDSHKKL